jgi:hypothetical protein
LINVRLKLKITFVSIVMCMLMPALASTASALHYSDPVPTGMYLTIAFLTPAGSASISRLFPASVVGITSRSIYNISSIRGPIFNAPGDETLALNSMALNNHILARNGHKDLRFTSSPGLMSTDKTAVNGSPAFEPIAMALIGAAIVALPLARRLRRSIKKET